MHQHRRRRFLIAAGTLLAVPLAAKAQPLGKAFRIGYLGNHGTVIDGLRQGLREHGWIEGKNIVIEYRWAEGSVDRLPALAAELVRLNLDLIVAASSTHVKAVKETSSTIPIVFATHADPVGTGDVASLAHPGGNITGLAILQTELNAKELELLQATVPRAKRVALLWNPSTPSHAPGLKAAEQAGHRLGLTLQLVGAQSAAELEGAFAAMKRGRAEAVMVIASPMSFAERLRIADLAIKNRLPTMFGPSQNVEAGGLMSYGANYADMGRRSAAYVDKILRGAKPGDLPIEQAQKFEFVINMKTATTLGVKIPVSILSRADRVIE